MDYKALRERMVGEQLMHRGIDDKRVLSAFLKVKRHEFVPDNLKNDAYGDFPLPIGENQTISQPYIVALMSEVLAVGENDKVLEVGAGCGYQTAILLELSGLVYSIELLDSLAQRARKSLSLLGYDNATIRVGDGALGWPEEAPFDRILVAAATKVIPPALITQLKNGGRMIIPLGETSGQTLTLVEKKDNQINSTGICGCVFVPLVSTASRGEMN